MVSTDIMRGVHDILILSLLVKADSYGYEISQNITNYSAGAYTIKETTLYSALGRLEKSGYIVSYDGDKTLGPPRTYFKLTNFGKQYLMDKIAEWKSITKLLDTFIKLAE
ncbi:PadR family transcriptional regulator [Treponema phagedenis]|uniref:PadR family transcriptional regulator n=1 Tax=Treponema phagedenis TaxID=162 RepID=A0AAE6IWY9_TREPH|nr:PadR family transcriptional regulator [Treponema phagedenis]QEJ96438.1 PadR family transcriptional regulator [Treponema phagedenis]QEJ99595.1 PadR family transcriptional regulator [Treponema phagedenis]QEK02220.1 PadR family transcriptional regulator [Treponema phagedenis]QEK05146.1 PadR family transcriptional regulator [Treponema phagedenis]